MCVPGGRRSGDRDLGALAGTVVVVDEQAVFHEERPAAAAVAVGDQHALVPGFEFDVGVDAVGAVADVRGGFARQVGHARPEFETAPLAVVAPREHPAFVEGPVVERQDAVALGFLPPEAFERSESRLGSACARSSNSE